MKLQSQHSEFRPGDLVRLVREMISFYEIYGPADPGFLSGDPVMVLEIVGSRAIVQDSLGNRHSSSLKKLQHA